jgi:hypothetical protein
MELTAHLVRAPLRDTHRLIPSRYPPVGILDTITSPDDLPAILELEGWTNDRVSLELGIIHSIPKSEWVVGKPNAIVIMAAFCHPRPEGSRFSDSDRGAWYAALSLDAALAETIFHRTKELAEIGVIDTRVEMRQYLADFDCAFHDVRPSPDFDALYDPVSYSAGQSFARTLFDAGSNGVRYWSVRCRGAECVACFRPPLVNNVRQGSHFEYLWDGSPTPSVRELT